MFAAAAPFVAAGAGLAGAYMQNKGRGKDIPMTQTSGIGAAPSQVQDYLRRANTPLYNINMPNAMQNMNKYPVQPGQANMPGQSQALAALQGANPNHDLNYMGMEPMNEAQIRALREAQMSGQPGSLANYMQPFNKELEARLRGVNRTYDEYLKKANDEDAIYNSQISPASNTQLKQERERIAQNRANSIGDVEGLMEGRAFDRANQYRNQSLEQILNAGNIQQQFGQELANNATGYNLTANQPGYGHSAAMNSLATPYFGSGQQQGGQPGQLNSMGRYGALLMSAPAMYNSFQNMQNQGNQTLNPYNNQPYNSTNNIQGTPWNTVNPYGNQFGQQFGRY